MTRVGCDREDKVTFIRFKVPRLEQVLEGLGVWILYIDFLSGFEFM